MFLLTHRQTRAALSAAAGAAVYLAASELGARKLKLTGLFILASAAMAGMATAKASAKAYNVENRFNHLLTNGGTFGGNITVNGAHQVNGSQVVTGNHTIQGSLFGTGGTISAGDALHVVSNDFTADGRITAHGNCGVDGNMTAGTIGPGGTRANLGSEPFTSAGLNNAVARIDYTLGTLLTSANISY